MLVTAYGYHAEFESATSAVVYGPFPTSAGTNSLQIFGPDTASNSFSNPGLGLNAQTTGSLTPTETDLGLSTSQLGFDNGTLKGDFPTIQFALFTFSQSVDISQVIVGNVSNLGQSAWIAGGSGTPDVETDLLGLLTTLGVQTKLASCCGSEAVHNVSLTGLDYLLVGTPPRNDDYGPLTATGYENFYINGLSDGATIVPIPQAFWLFGSGLLGLVGLTRRKKAA